MGERCTFDAKPFVALLFAGGTSPFLRRFGGEEREAMEYEIDDCDMLFDKSTNPSLARRARERSRHSRLASWNKPCQKAVAIPEEEEQLA